MTKRMIVAVALAAALAASGPAAAQLDRGVELFERAEFDAAADVLAPLAKGGDAQAQYVLGVMYLHRMVAPPSETAAADLLIKAGESGSKRAHVELSRMYREGDGVEQDFGRSFFWSKKAAEAGDVGAQLQVADSLAFGHGVEKDPIEAYKWYEIAVLYWGSLAVHARDLVAESMSADQVAEAQARAQLWIETRGAKN